MSTHRQNGTNGSPYAPSPFGKPAPDKLVTHERIAADMAAFSKAGGQVEILGVTPLRRKHAKDDAAPADNGASAKKSAPVRSRSD